MKKLLLVVDLINDIIHPDGKLAHYADRIIDNNILANTNHVIRWARRNSIQVAHVKVGFSKGYHECPKHSPMFGRVPELQALMLGTWGTEFHTAIEIHPDDLIIIKHRVNAFYATDLEALLRAQDIKQLYLCGVATNYAIEHTARDAHDRDYRVNIIIDACEAASQEAHDTALSSLSRFCELLESPNAILPFKFVNPGR